MTELTWLEKVRRAAAADGRQPDPTPEGFDADLIPELEYERPLAELALDEFLATITTLDAYRWWCGKQIVPETLDQREIKVSCPHPQHPDENPSACINPDKDTFVCYRCAGENGGFLGGDAYDIAAWHFGFPVPDYKTNGDFPELRRIMAEDRGFAVEQRDRREVVYVDVGAPDIAPAPEATSAEEDAQEAPGTLLRIPQPDDDLPTLPPIDWQSIVPMGSFLWKWMNVTTRWDAPDEYLWWMGLQAVGAACGDDVVLIEQPPIEPNLYVCLYGPSGIGKSRAVRMLTDLLRAALPYDQDDPHCKGTYVAPTPASGEALSDIFSKPEIDDTDPTGKLVLGFRQVRGYVRFDELATLTSKMGRQGSALAPVTMSLYDGDLASDLSRGNGLKGIENPFCQMIATTQPRVIRHLLSQENADSGFVNRWVFAAPVGRKEPVSYGREPFDPQPLVMPLRTVHEWAKHGRRFRLEGEALDLWSEFFYREIVPIKENSEDMPLLVRGELTLFKLIVLLTANDMKPQPGPEHVQAALAVWPYLRATYALLGEEIGMGELDACARDVLKALPELQAALGRPPSARDLMTLRFGRRWKRDVVLATLKVLKETEEINEETYQSQKGGRKTFRYTLRDEGDKTRYRLTESGRKRL